MERGLVGCTGIEMYVRHKGSVKSLATQTAADLAKIGGFAHALGGEPQVFSSGGYYPACLIDAGVGVERRCRGHRLDSDRIVATEGGSTYVDFFRFSALVIEY